jgi:DMSO/TMAO reductase YedYZ molybdopterin-dependent catalytic subunit
MKPDLSRRRFLTGASLGATAFALSGCKVLDGLNDYDNPLRAFMQSANSLTYRSQRLLTRDALAPEFTRADIRQGQRPNGTTNPADADYQALAAGGFAEWRLNVQGAVEKPLTLTLAELQARPSRTQITRHDCVEGWSCIAEWTGVQLSQILAEARPKPEARFAIFYCHDTMENSLSGPVKYYESIDLIDANHPQTILAYGLNGKPLPIENGAPLRVRVERQLGYKMAKYVHTIELASILPAFGKGHGGYWEDKGYDWYGGI